MGTGRRRHSALRASPLLLITLFLTIIQTASAFAVLGIDIGTKNIKATLVKPGTPLEIVLTKDSRRKQASAIAFKPGQSANVQELPERVYGDDALAIQARFPGDVYPNIKPLLALSSVDSAVAEEYKKRYPALKLVRDNARDEVGFKSANFGAGEDFFSVEELLGMELQLVKENAQDMAGPSNPIKGIVVSVPPFYTAEEKRAVEVAAELAGLKVMSFVSDGLAVGLNFATARTFPDVSKGEKAEHHLVYDMGAGSTTATLLRFQAKTSKEGSKTNKTVQEVTVLSTAWDRTLGGDAMTDLVVNDLITKFLDSKAAKKLDLTEETIRSHGKSMAKINKAAESVRGVLSANTATSSTISGLFADDLDFTYKLSRADFETLTSNLLSRTTAPITAALADAQLAIEELDSVILHGGAMRTPFVQKQLEAIVGDAKKLRSNVNSDEAAVFGAAFKAASQSPSFRVKQIKSLDIATYTIEMSWEHDGKERRQNIFHASDIVGSKKQLSFKNTEDFSVFFKQNVADSTERLVTTSSLDNLTASIKELETKYGCQKEDVKTTISLQLSPLDALPEVVGGVVSCESDGPIEKKSTGEGVVDGVKGFFGFGGKKDSSTDPSSASGSSSSASSAATPSPSSKSKSKKKKNETEELGPGAKKTYKINLSASTIRQGDAHPPTEELTKMKARLETFDQADQGRRLRDDLFNVLESTAYRTRDMLTEKGFMDVSTSAQRDAVESALSSISEWLYPDGAHSGIDAIRERLSGLQDLVDPISKRKEEAASRPKLIKQLREGIENGETIVKAISSQVAAASSAVSSASAAVSSSASEVVSDAVSDAEESASSAVLDEGATESASSSTVTPAPSPTPENPWSMFTDEDVDQVKETLEEVKKWFVDKMALQNKLGSSDEPMLTVADMKSRLQTLDGLGSELFSKVKRAEKAASSSSSRLKASASASKASASKAAKASASSLSSAAAAAAKAASSAIPDSSSRVTASIPEYTEEVETPVGEEPAAESTIEHGEL